MMFRSSHFVGMLFVIGFLIAGSGCGKKIEQANRKPAASPYVVEVVKVSPRPYKGTLFGTGTLRAQESVRLQAERAGVITKVDFEEGRPVKAGQVMVAIDDSELRAQLARNEAQLQLATATEKRSAELLEAQALSQAEYDESQANLNVAKAEVDLIKAQLAKTRIVAPFDGIAGLRQVSPGAYLTPGTSVATLQDLRSLKLDFTLPERYLPQVRKAQTVSVRVAGVAGSLTGKIDAIEPVVSEATRSLLVRALIPNEEQRLLPGAFAEVEVALEEVPDAILIPAIALIPGLKEQKVFLHKDGEVEQRQVRVGRRTATSVQIEEGLKGGEELIISGILQLRPKMKVKIKEVSEQQATNAVSGVQSSIPGARL